MWDKYLPWAKEHKKSWKDDEYYYRKHLEPRFGSKRLLKNSNLLKPHAKRTSSYEIQEVVGDLFNGRVGCLIPMRNSRLFGKKGRSATREKFFLATRTTEKTRATSSGPTQLQEYGDLVVWRQIIDRAIEAKKEVIFVNDDKKKIGG